MNLITINESRIATDLAVLRSKLESEGIPCFMKDELSTQVLNYLPLNTVKLQVYEKDAERAFQIMNGLNNSVEISSKIVCPECGSEEVKIKIPVKTRLRIIAYIFMNALTFSGGATPIYNVRYICSNCSNNFTTPND